MSADLQFLLLSKYNSYTLRRNGALLSAEPLNVTNRNTQRQTGTINNSAINVQRNTDGTYELLHKDPSVAPYQPKSTVKRTAVTDESSITNITDKLNPKQAPYVIAKFRALKRSEGQVSKTYRPSQRHVQRAEQRAAKRAARR